MNNWGPALIRFMVLIPNKIIPIILVCVMEILFLMVSFFHIKSPNLPLQLELSSLVRAPVGKMVL